MQGHPLWVAHGALGILDAAASVDCKGREALAQYRMLTYVLRLTVAGNAQIITEDR